MLILSICIPSYNRFCSLKATVELILQAKSRDFEIIILDNKSPQDIEKEILIHDDRLHILKRGLAVNSKENSRDCLLYATGIYTMFCLDKDNIDGRKLDDFLYVLRQNSTVYGGYCIQNKTSENGNVKICNYNAILEFGYLGKHPSGDFYKTEYINKYLNLLSDREIDSGFISDLLLAKCASQGAMLFYNKPLVFLEKSQNAAKIKSYTYSKEKKNIFFYPDNREEQFKVYIHHMQSLNIADDIKEKVLKRIYVQKIIEVTIGFKKIMKLTNICMHYNITTTHITFKNMFQYWLSLNRCFLSRDLQYLSIYNKYWFIIRSIIILLIKFRK